MRYFAYAWSRIGRWDLEEMAQRGPAPCRSQRLALDQNKQHTPYKLKARQRNCFTFWPASNLQQIWTSNGFLTYGGNWSRDVRFHGPLRMSTTPVMDSHRKGPLEVKTPWRSNPWMSTSSRPRMTIHVRAARRRVCWRCSHPQAFGAGVKHPAALAESR